MKKYITLFAIIIISSFAIVSVVSAATTISTDIQTNGQLSVTGTSTLTGPIMGPIGINTIASSSLAQFLLLTGNPFINHTIIFGYEASTTNSIVTFGKTPLLALVGDNNGNSTASIGLLQVAIGPGGATPSELYIGSTRGATAASRVAVDNGDILGGISFFGDDGNNIRTRGSKIDSVVDTSVASTSVGVVPARLELGTISQAPIVFFTNVGAVGNSALSAFGTSHERMRIDYNGNVGIGTPNPSVPLEIVASTTNATTTIQIGQSGQTKGSCLVLFDAAGNAVYASVAAGATTLTLSSTSCK